MINISNINIQQQHSRSFLLGEGWTPGKIAQHFNQIANLDIIDEATRNVKKWTAEIEKNIGFKEASLAGNKVALNEFPDLDMIETEFEKVKELQEKEETKKQAVLDIKKNLAGLSLIGGEIKEKNTLLSLEEDVNSIEDLIRKKEEKEKQKNELQGLLSKKSGYARKIEKKKVTLSFEQDVEHIYAVIEKKEEKEKQKIKFNNLIDQIKVLKRSISIDSTKLRTLQAKFEKNMPKTCPLCGNEKS